MSRVPPPTAAPTARFSYSTIDRIRPDSDQVRTHNKDTADEEVRELAESIKAVGVENPLTVRYLREQDIYELIAG